MKLFILSWWCWLCWSLMVSVLQVWGGHDLRPELAHHMVRLRLVRFPACSAALWFLPGVSPTHGHLLRRCGKEKRLSLSLVSPSPAFQGHRGSAAFWPFQCSWERGGLKCLLKLFLTWPGILEMLKKLLSHIQISFESNLNLLKQLFQYLKDSFSA